MIFVNPSTVLIKRLLQREIFLINLTISKTNAKVATINEQQTIITAERIQYGQILIHIKVVNAPKQEQDLLSTNLDKQQSITLSNIINQEGNYLVKDS